MAGLSRRFSRAGFALPKYMLEAGGKSLFRHAVEGFSHYFKEMPFLFVLRDIHESRAFVVRECGKMGLDGPLVTVLGGPTRGQAETVMRGLDDQRAAGTTPLTIFNIDTFRPGFRYPSSFDAASVDGYLEVFRGSGANWSYVRPRDGEGARVAETAEKKEISDLCCTGLYHFSRADLFARSHARAATSGTADELYVAPLYNLLIEEGADIRFDLIERDAVTFCGVPEEYETFKERSKDGRN